MLGSLLGQVTSIAHGKDRVLVDGGDPAIVDDDLAGQKIVHHVLKISTEQIYVHRVLRSPVYYEQLGTKLGTKNRVRASPRAAEADRITHVRGPLRDP
jgi:hypothetical protein